MSIISDSIDGTIWILSLSSLGERYPVDFDIVWYLMYERKEDAVEVLLRKCKEGGRRSNLR